MKHYLDLIKISARQHRKQNRMTRLCIVLAVFLVTVIFGMADMEMRSQMIQASQIALPVPKNCMPFFAFH